MPAESMAVAVAAASAVAEAVTVELAPRLPTMVGGSDSVLLRGRLRYLDRMVVSPLHPNGEGGWACRVIAAHHHPAGGRVEVSADELAAAATTVTVDPTTDPDLYAVAWMAAAWRIRPGGTTVLAANAMAHRLREPGTIRVDLDRAALLTLAEATRLRRPGLRRLVHRFTIHTLLTPATSTANVATSTDAGIGNGWGVHRLHFPARMVTAVVGHGSRDADQ